MWQICMFERCLSCEICNVLLQKSISENDYHPDLLEEDISDKDIDFYQPDLLEEEISDKNIDFPIGLPKKIT